VLLVDAGLRRFDSSVLFMQVGFPFHYTSMKYSVAGFHEYFTCMKPAPTTVHRGVTIYLSSSVDTICKSSNHAKL